MIVQGTQVIFTTLNSPKWPKRNVPGGENCQTFWMVIFSIQFDLDVASGQKLEGNVTTLYELGLIRGKNRMMLMIIWEEERSKWNWLNLGIMDARNVASGSLPHTYHCHQSWQIHFWWTFVGGNVFFGGICFEYLYFTSLLRNTNTHRKEKIRKYIWKVNFDSKRAVLWCVPGSAGAFSMWPPHRRHVVNMHFHLPQHSYQSPIHDM